MPDPPRENRATEAEEPPKRLPDGPPDRLGSIKPSQANVPVHQRLRLIASAAVSNPASDAQLPIHAISTVRRRRPRRHHLRFHHLLDVPSPALLVRSAGERLRQLSARWGAAEGVAGAVGSAVLECRVAALDWARTTVAHQRRLSSRSGGEQWIGGVREEFAYTSMPASGLSLLALATELGIGKDVSMGCGVIRLLIGDRGPNQRG